MNNSTKPLIRETFGIIDGKTGKLYSDILSYALEREILTDETLLPNSVKYRKNLCYILQMDSRLRRALRTEKMVNVIISYQRRTTGNIALARLDRLNELNRKENK